MSLDLYIIAPEPVVRKGTGVIVRNNGRTEELATIEEVRKYFPDADLSNIKEREFLEDYVWHENITHNMNAMAMHCPIGDKSLYEYLWRPEEIGFLKVSSEYVSGLTQGYLYLKSRKDDLMQYNPPVDSETGQSWGSYDLLLNFCLSLINCLLRLDYDKADYGIEASR